MRKWLMEWLLRRSLQDHVLRQPFNSATRETRTTCHKIMVSYVARGYWKED